MFVEQRRKCNFFEVKAFSGKCQDNRRSTKPAALSV